MKNKFFLLLAAMLFSSVVARAQDASELYEQLFGRSVVEAELSLAINGLDAGELPAKMQGESVKEIDGDILRSKLQALLKAENFSLKGSISGWISPESLSYPWEYDPARLLFVMNIPLEELRPSFTDMANNPQLRFAGRELAPAPFAGALDLSLERNLSGADLGNDSLIFHYDAFLNARGFVLSSKNRYEKDYGASEEGRWVHGESNLVKDILPWRARITAGDAFSRGAGFKKAKQVLGLNVRRQFSISPYDKPFAQAAREVTLPSRSRVKTYVNGSLIKDEVLPPGNYQMANLPLMDGVNLIEMHIEDEFGLKRVESFSAATSEALLKAGESDFSLTYGRPYRRHERSREYEDDQLIAAYWLRGIGNNYSLGAYGEKEGETGLAGLTQGVATKLGNFFLEASVSDGDMGKGSAQALSWSLRHNGGAGGPGVYTAVRYENYQDNFDNNSGLFDAPLKHSLEYSVSAPLPRTRMTLTLSVGRASYQEGDFPDRKSLHLSSNWRLNRQMSLNFYGSRLSDRFGEESVSASAFFTWSFNDGVFSLFRDIEAKATRASYQQGNYNELYRPRLSASVQDGHDRRADVGASVSLPMAELSARLAAIKHEDSAARAEGGVRVATTALFAYDDAWSYGLSKPAGQGSFALFRPSENLRGQKIALTSTSPYADTQTALFGDLAITNLVPYQYRQVEIDQEHLDDGIFLRQQSFALLPGYKSGHLVKLEDKGIRSVEGILVFEGEPLKLKVGRLGPSAFFTNDQGYFFVEGSQAGELHIQIDGKEARVSIAETSSGVVDLGMIELKSKLEQERRR